MDLTEFNEIRPYNDEELPQIFEELIADPAFRKLLPVLYRTFHLNFWRKNACL